MTSALESAGLWTWNYPRCFQASIRMVMVANISCKAKDFRLQWLHYVLRWRELYFFGPLEEVDFLRVLVLQLCSCLRTDFLLPVGGYVQDIPIFKFTVFPTTIACVVVQALVRFSSLLAKGHVVRDIGSKRGSWGHSRWYCRLRWVAALVNIPSPQRTHQDVPMDSLLRMRCPMLMSGQCSSNFRYYYHQKVESYIVGGVASGAVRGGCSWGVSISTIEGKHVRMENASTCCNGWMAIHGASLSGILFFERQWLFPIGRRCWNLMTLGCQCVEPSNCWNFHSTWAAGFWHGP